MSEGKKRTTRFEADEQGFVREVERTGQAETAEPKSMAARFGRRLNDLIGRVLGRKEKTPEEIQMEKLKQQAQRKLEELYTLAGQDMARKGNAVLESAGKMRAGFAVFERFLEFSAEKFPLDENFWTVLVEYFYNLKVDGHLTFQDHPELVRIMDNFGREPKLAKVLLYDVLQEKGERAKVILNSEKLLGEDPKVRAIIVDQLLGVENTDTVRKFLRRYAEMMPHALNTEQKVANAIRFCEDSSPFKRR